MLVPLQIPTLFISNLLVQLFSPATAAQCACDQKPEHGFLKLIGTPSQRQFDLWMEFGEKLEVVEMTLRQNYPTLQFPYEVAMQLYKGELVLDQRKTLKEYGFHDGDSIRYQLYNNSAVNRSDRIFPKSFHMEDSRLIQIARDNRPIQAFLIDFNAPVKEVLEEVGKKDGRFYTELQFKLFPLDAEKSLADYHIGTNETLLARSQLSVQNNYYPK